MRQYPEPFVTVAVSVIALLYYCGIGAQILRVRRIIRRSPVMWGATPLERLRTLGVFLWPLPALTWARSPGWFSGLPHVALLENWGARLLGLLLVMLAGAMATAAYGALGEHWRIGVDPADASGFVRAGIYGTIRHPVYAALWLVLLGFFLLAPNLLLALLWALGSSAASAQADLEDRHLAQAYGKAYRDYMLVTGKFFPLIY